MQGFLSFLSFLLWVGGGRLMWLRWRVAAFLAGTPALFGSSLALCSAGNSSRAVGLFRDSHKGAMTCH